MLKVTEVVGGYGSVQILNGVTMSVEPGRIVALLGGNGTGKSTMISLLCGIRAPDAGAIRIGGHDMGAHAPRAKALLAYVPDAPVAYEFMTGAAFLAMVDALRGTRDAQRAAGLITGLGLDPHMGKRFDAMSLGTAKKIMLVSALMSQARLILMDEPTNGIDADARQFLIGLIRREAAQRLFFFATHDEELVTASGAQRLRLSQTDA